MLKVIIADDEERICELLENLVNWQELGFEIAAFAHDGIEVLEKIKLYHPDVVITDIQMPECSGLELLDKIREQKLDIDVLVISGYREFDYAKKALQYGAENYLLKPIKRSELTVSLMNIKNRRQEQAAEKKRYEDTQRLLDSSKGKLQNTLMEDIINGRRKMLTVEEINSEYSCGFTEDKLSFMSVKTDYMSGDVNSKELEVIQQKNKNLISSIFEAENIQVCIISDWNILYVLVNAQVDRLDRAYNRIIRGIKDFAGKQTVVQVSIGVADINENNAHRAYTQSRAAVMNQLHDGTNKVLKYDMPAAKIEASAYLNSDFINKIRDHIVAFDAKRLHDKLYRLLSDMQNSKRPVVSGENVYTIMAAVLDQIFFQIALINKEVELEDLRNKYELLLRMCAKWANYEFFIQNISKEITDVMRELQSEREKRPIKAAKEIIQKNYNTPITVENISAMLGLNNTYFSGVFKKETGMTVSAYITQLRMDKAKQLLANTSESMSYIADAIGFNDEKYFMRRFKKEVGLTPGEYRKLYG